MAAARPEYTPDPSTPQRQLLTVAELEQLFGPDATVELRSMRPERVEADLEIIPPAPRTSRWMAPVLLVVFGAASLLGYALLRSAAPLQTAASFRSWIGSSTLGATEELPVERDYRLQPLVAKIPESIGPVATPAQVEPAPSSLEPAPVADQAPAVYPVPPSSLEPPAAPPKPQALAVPPAPAPKRRSVRPPPAPVPAVDREADDEATRSLIEREVDRLASPRSENRARDEADDSAIYPPGYIEAPVR